MNTARVRIFLGCLLISMDVETTQSNKYCRQQASGYLFVNVCEDNSVRSISPGAIIMIDAAGAPVQQNVECKCYINFDQPQQYTQNNLFMYRGGTQHATFNINGRTYIDDSTSMNITSGTTILFRQDYQDHPARVCMGIKSDTTGGSLTVRCEAYDNTSHMLSTEKQAATEITSTHSLHTDNESPKDDLTVILCASIGGGLFLMVTVTIVLCAVKRKRWSTKKVAKDSEPDGKRKGATKELTDLSAECTLENAATPGMISDTYETDNIMTSEYVDVDQCELKASANFNCKIESDLYNHLNEIQSGPHSDNVYSTTHVYNTTKQHSIAMSKQGPSANPSESDVYNHLNEVRASPHSDNIYNAANVHGTPESDATSSQYDSVELVTRKHHVKPDSDYNVLSFP